MFRDVGAGLCQLFSFACWRGVRFCQQSAGGILQGHGGRRMSFPAVLIFTGEYQWTGVQDAQKHVAAIIDSPVGGTGDPLQPHTPCRVSPPHGGLLPWASSGSRPLTSMFATGMLCVPVELPSLKV